METKDNVGLLYNALKQQGFNDIGDENVFRSKMSDENNRKQLYNALQKNGFSDMGDYDTFNSKLSSKSPGNNETSVSQQVIDEYDASNGNTPIVPWQQPQNYVERSPRLGVSPTQHLTDAAIAPVKEMLNNNAAEPIRDDKGRPYYPLKPKAVMEDEIRKDYQIDPVESQIDKAIAANEEAIRQIEQGKNKEYDKYAEEHPYLHAFGGFARQYEGRVPDVNPSDNKEALRNLYAERDKLTKAKQMIDTSRAEGVFNNLGKGIKDAVRDNVFWDLGMSEMSGNSQLLGIKKKLDNNKPLTEDEQRLLNAAALEQEVGATHQDRISHWYTAGQTTANMIPFMAEMAINPAAGLGKAAQKAVVRKISGAVGKSLAKKILPKLARTTGDIVGASVMTGTTGAMRTIADAENRILGEVDSSIKDGKIIGDGFSGGLDKLEASGKAFAANTIENWSEMLGEYFAPALKGAGYIAGKGMRKMGMGKVMDFISDVNSTPFAKGLDDILEQTKWNGPIGEIAEEEAGIIANSFITGDNKLSDLIDPKQQLDIVLGVGLFGGFVSGIKTINYRTPEKRAERDFHKSEKNASSMFDNWEDLRSEIDNADEIELPDVINSISNSDVVGNDRNKKAAIIDYAYSLQKWRGENAAKMKQGVENPETMQEMTDEKGDIVDLEEEKSSTPINKVSVYRDFVRADRKAKQVLPEEIVSQLPSVSDVEGFAAEYNLNDAQKEAVKAYSNAYGLFSMYQGDVIKRRQDIASSAREQAISDVEHIANQDTGNVVQVKHKFLDNPVYLVGGRLSFGEDGLLDRENSDDKLLKFRI